MKHSYTPASLSDTPLNSNLPNTDMKCSVNTPPIFDLSENVRWIEDENLWKQFYVSSNLECGKDIKREDSGWCTCLAYRGLLSQEGPEMSTGNNFESYSPIMMWNSSDKVRYLQLISWPAAGFLSLSSCFLGVKIRTEMDSLLTN